MKIIEYIEFQSLSHWLDNVGIIEKSNIYMRMPWRILEESNICIQMCFLKYVYI